MMKCLVFLVFATLVSAQDFGDDFGDLDMLLSMCNVDGKVYSDGDVIRDSPCGPCECYEGEERCPVAECMPPNCVDAIDDEDQCCGFTCPNGDNCMMSDGTILSQDEELKKETDDGCTVTCTCPTYGVYADCRLDCQQKFFENLDE